MNASFRFGFVVLCSVVTVTTVDADYLEVRRSANLRELATSSSARLEKLEKGMLLELLSNGVQTNGYYKVKHIDGVLKDKLRGLHLVEYSPAGLSIRHIFADVGTLSLGDRGATILLEDGASMRGDEKTAFLRGRFRIYLPKADQDLWKAESLPGLGSAPD